MALKRQREDIYPRSIWSFWNGFDDHFGMLRSHVIKAIPSLILGLIGNVRERRRRYQNSSSSTIVSIRNESPHYSASSTPDKYRQFRTSPGRLRRATTTICSTANVYCSLDRAESLSNTCRSLKDAENAGKFIERTLVFSESTPRRASPRRFLSCHPTPWISINDLRFVPKRLWNILKTIVIFFYLRL